jgi:pimeloyl-ACP methyl ester carboxylesterase
MAILERVSGRLHYDLQGSGPPLVLLAGANSTRHDWAPHLPALAARYCVITLDPRGAGETTWRGEMTIATLVQDVLWLLDSLGLERAHLLGVSMGGHLALEAALRAPERIGGLVLALTSPGADAHT